MFIQYNDIITKETNDILSFVENIKKSFDNLFKINNVQETIETRKTFYENVFLVEFSNIDLQLSLINEKLQYIRNFCYQDLEKIATILNKTDDIDFVKNSSKIEGIINNFNISLDEKTEIINCLKLNENIRFLIHQVMNILSISKPIFIKRILEKEFSKNEILKDNNFILLKLRTNLFQIFKFEKDLKLLNNINNNLNIDLSTCYLKYLNSYIDIYSDRILEYSYAGEVFKIYLKSFNTSTIDSIFSNQSKIEEVLDVIINNACEELCNKEIQIGQPIKKLISVSMFNTNKFLNISIKDNGRGIPQNLIDKIYEPYVTSKASNGGSGIGLAAAKRILNLLKGELKVKTNSNGSTFTIVIPIN